MRKDLILEIITKLLLPFMIGFAIYLQLNGEASPGGGFQAGMILAAGFILYGLIEGNAKLHTFISDRMVNVFIVVGGLIYGGTGIVCMLNGGEFLNYYFLNFGNFDSQHLGITVVEIGVGLTVFAVTLKIFYYFAEGDNNDSTE